MLAYRLDRLVTQPFRCTSPCASVLDGAASRSQLRTVGWSRESLHSIYPRQRGHTASGRLFERVTAGGVARDRAKCGAMISSEVQRTLVKSPPELWAEISDPASLARHLGEFGEIRITRCLLYTSDAADEEDS